ncbi:redoxin family protein [Singulisphaera sp. PoT]|uniref:redoxin family protein n=1 Tax=Singulisphaera sp. PoT TaxID=3411797 RepID=UPI003BF5D0DE
MRLLPATFRLAILLAGLAGAPVRSWALDVGDPAPRLEVSRWAKGEKVDRLDPGKVYVVEFWATWCEPCRFAMPHLTKLQETYKDKATFIGVSVWESDQAEVDPFVARMGDKLGYRVALDVVPEGDRAESRGKTADAWLAASGTQGIPQTFLVKGGRIAWIGHPMELDEPLAKAVAGTWDFDAAAKERLERRTTEARVGALFEAAGKLVQERKHGEAIAGLDRAILAEPELERRLGLMKVGVLVASGDAEALVAYGSRLCETIWKDDSDALNFLALTIVVEERKAPPSPPVLALAMRAAERAVEITRGESGRILDTLGRVCFASGDPGRAARLEEKALSLAEKDVPHWRERLNLYRKAIEAKRR